MKLKLIMIKLIYTTLNNKSELSETDILWLNYSKFSKEEMPFETNAEEIENLKKQNVISKNTNFNHLCKSKISTYSNAKINKNYNQAKQIYLNTEIQFSNKCIIDNEKLVNKLLIQEGLNFESIHNKTPINKPSEFEVCNDQDKGINISQVMQLIQFIQKKCINISLYQFNLLEKPQFDKTKFISASNDLFSLLKDRIYIQKHFNIRKQNPVLISKNFVKTKSLCILENHNQQSVNFQNYQKYSSNKLKFPTIQPLKTCKRSNIKKNIKHFSLLFKHHPIHIIDKNLLLQDSDKQELTFNTDKLIYSKQFTNQMNENIFANKSNATLSQGSWISALSKDTKNLNLLKKCSKSELLPNKSTHKNKQKFNLQTKCDKQHKRASRKIIKKDYSLTQTSDKEKNCFESNVIDNEISPNSSIELPNLLNFFSCSPVNNENEDSENSDSTENNVTESFEPAINEKFKLKFYKTKKCMLSHKNAYGIKLFTRNIDFININYMKFRDYENEKKTFPEGFSFSHGWRKYRLCLKNIHKCTTKPPYLLTICEEYGLESYFSLIFTMIKINTHSKKTCFISLQFCFHICCYHLCTIWNLGKGKNFKLNENTNFYTFINNKNYKKLYKTKDYWKEKAKILFQKAENRALLELGITSSSFTKFHLYNFLLLLPFQNSFSIAFVCYVYHATYSREVDSNLLAVTTDKIDDVIHKRKKLEKIFQRYAKYKGNAKQIYTILSKN
ncbi:hypothetical protein NUSPORA_01596 [Nucleospora cyclopteri]